MQAISYFLTKKLTAILMIIKDDKKKKRKNTELKYFLSRFSLPLSILAIANNQPDCPGRVFSLPVASRWVRTATVDDTFFRRPA